MTPTQRRLLRLLADRGMQTAATLATGASLSLFGATVALQQLADAGCVERVGGYWLLSVAGVDQLRTAVKAMTAAVLAGPWEWVDIKDGHRGAFAIARRHYSAKKNRRPKIRLFVGPGEKTVLLTGNGHALFVWRKFIDDSGQTGVNCALFRNENTPSCRNSVHLHCSSNLIRRACDIAWQRWPGERLYSYVDARQIRSSYPGYCFIRAGWGYVRDDAGKPLLTKAGQHILEVLPGVDTLRASGVRG